MPPDAVIGWGVLEVRGQLARGAVRQGLRLALASWAVLAWCAPATAAEADFAAEARRLDAALAKREPVPPRIVARGFIAGQARSLAADAKFRAAVRKEADRHGAKLAEAMLAEPKLFRSTALAFGTLMATQRAAVADQLAARGEREAKRLTTQEAKDAQLVEARKKLDAAKKRAASAPPLPTTLDATALLAAFLALNLDGADLGEKTSAVLDEVHDAVDTAASTVEACIATATADYEDCIAENPFGAVCEVLLAAESLDCLTP